DPSDTARADLLPVPNDRDPKSRRDPRRTRLPEWCLRNCRTRRDDPRSAWRAAAPPDSSSAPWEPPSSRARRRARVGNRSGARAPSAFERRRKSPVFWFRARRAAPRFARSSASSGTPRAARRLDSRLRPPPRQGVNGRSIEHRALDREPGAVTRTVPGPFAGIEGHLAAEVRADRREHVEGACVVAVHRQAFAGDAHDLAFTATDLVER